MREHDQTTGHEELKRERWELLRQINDVLEKPMIALGFVWLGLLILDLTVGLTPPMVILSNIIWALFWVDFLIRVTLAPEKLAFLRANWLTALALLLPALRVLRLFRALRLLRAARAARSINLVRLVTSLNRGMRATSAALGQRGFGFVLTLTILVVFGGAAGMFFLERPTTLAGAGVAAGVDEPAGLISYGEALWYTVMLLTTLGSDYWPQTLEGRVLTLLLSLYGFAVFGYITATIASFFIGRDAASREATPPASDERLRAEIAALREQIAALNRRLDATSTDSRPGHDEG